MKALRTKHSPMFKAKVGLEALKEQKTSAELKGITKCILLRSETGKA